MSSQGQAYKFTKKKKNSHVKALSIEMFKNLPKADCRSLHEIAASGDLDELKSHMETFGATSKELDKKSRTLLHSAAMANQTAIMEYLIESGADLNMVDEDGNTALHLAVVHGHIEAMSLLLNKGADDKILNKNMDPPLHIAARSNNCELMAAFLGHPNVFLYVTGYRKRTVIHVTAEKDLAEMLEVIRNSPQVKLSCKVAGGFRLCVADEDELTPIHLAARKGSHRVLDMCFQKAKDHGYSTEVILGFIDEENSTPLHAAIDGGFIKVVEVLLKHGADPTVKKENQIPPFLMACSQGKLEMIEAMLKSNNSEAISCRDVYGQTCLHHCAHAIDSTHIISFLINQGAEVDTVDNKGQSPLMTSVVAGSTSGVTTLLERGADIVLKDNEGKNALHHAVIRKKRKIVHMLLETRSAKELVVAADNKGLSPIHQALSLGHSEVVTAMIHVVQSKLKNIKDNDGNNYLHLAALGNNWKTLSILLEIPECLKLLNEINNYGGTPLHMAAFCGNLRSVEVLLSHGAMIHKCHCGHTPFMCACQKGYVDVARVLYEAHPFQLKWTSDKGETALHMGAASGSPAMIKYLLDIGVPVTHDFSQESFLDKIIKSNDVKCAAAIVEHKRYQECLDLVSPAHPHPMISLVAHMPEIANKILDRSHTKAEVASASLDYWEKFDFKYLQLECCHRLHRHRYLANITEEQEAVEEEGAEDQPMIADEKETMQTHVVRYKGSLKDHQPRGPAGRAKLHPMEVLKKMVKHNRRSLLTHPVTNAYLKSKWRAYGRWLHLGLVSFTFLQVFFLFLFTALVPRPNLVAMFAGTNNTDCGSGNNNSSSTDEEAVNSTLLCLEFSYGANLCRFITLGIASLNFLIWLAIVFQIRIEALNVIKNIYVVIDLLSIVFTVVYLIPIKGLHNAQWEAGAIAAFFAWFSLVLKIQLFDIFGVYVTMFLAITRRAFQVLLICFPFVLAFGLSFYILAGNLKIFSTIGFSLFINFAHLLGEIDYETFVAEAADGNLLSDHLTLVFVVVMAILLGIVIMNLLIGLAVGDIDQIQSNAIAEKKAIEVSYFTQFYTILPSQFFRHMDKPFFVIFPNKRVFFLRKLWHFFWRSLKGGDPDFDDDNLEVDTEQEQRNIEVLRIKEKVEELTLVQEKMLDMLHQMRDTQENMMKLILANNQSQEEQESSQDN